MTTEFPPAADRPQRPRRTWRQWSKLARVRIGFVLMLIVAISVCSWWLPRRGIVAITWMGGEVNDPEIVDQVQMAGRNLSVPIQTILWPWLQTRMSLLSNDKRIEVVNFSKVQSPHLDLAVLRHFPQLRWFVLHGRHLGPGLVMREVESLRGMCVNCPQQSSDLGELRHLPNLETLAIHTCPDSGGGFERLSLLPKLKEVMFDGTPSSSAMRGVSQCLNVETVSLQNVSINEDDLRFLSDMHGLIVFHVFGFPVGADGLKHIAQISSLKELCLDSSATDEEIQVLGMLTKLKRLRLYSSNSTKAGIDRLKAALPDCKIEGPDRGSG